MKFAYSSDVEQQALNPVIQGSTNIFVTCTADPVQCIRMEVTPGRVRKVSGDFLGLDGEETKELRSAPVVRYSSDVRLIIHQKDLAKRVGADVANRYLSQVQPASQFQQQLDKLSDSQILDCVRSRHIQSPSEIKAYSEALLFEAEKLQQQAADVIEKAQAAKAAEASASQSTAAPAASAAAAE